MAWELIRRETCGLCELAQQILVDLGRTDIPQRFLEDDPALETVYGWRIPVLRETTQGQELDWPFDRLKAAEFMRSVESSLGAP